MFIVSFHSISSPHAVTLNFSTCLARRFLFVFGANFISALVSIIIIMCEKSYSSDKEMLGLARKMDINNLTDEIMRRNTNDRKTKKKKQVDEDGEEMLDNLLDSNS